MAFLRRGHVQAGKGVQIRQNKPVSCRAALRFPDKLRQRRSAVRNTAQIKASNTKEAVDPVISGWTYTLEKEPPSP